jgi:hypothetical protein
MTAGQVLQKKLRAGCLCNKFREEENDHPRIDDQKSPEINIRHGFGPAADLV